MPKYFFFAREIRGDKRILLDYQKVPFKFTEGSSSTFEYTNGEFELSNYVIATRKRGDEYDGYLIVITDVRGEIIAYKSSRTRYFGMLENLRNLPVKKHFDDDGNRCFPTRPDRMY